MFIQKRQYIKAINLLNSIAIRGFSTTMEVNSKFDLPKRYQGSSPSVWVEYNVLAQKYKPLNLGQGFPDFSPPEHVTRFLGEVASCGDPILQQYTRGFGHPRLVNALAKLYSKLNKRKMDPLNEFLITSGAYEALFSIIQGHIDVGDEVIIIEPFFDCYEPMVRSAGGTTRYVPLKLNKTGDVITSADWVLDQCELEKAFNAKTKMIIVNTPHNPTGKVFNRCELQMIADLCQKWDVLCVSDEVYEWIVFDGAEHIRTNTIPGMWERTITTGSAGKTMSVTGWKIGWAYGPANLMVNLQMVHQNTVYTCPTPIQEALARSFELEIERLECGSPDCYFKALARELVEKRDFMAKFLEESGMIPTLPEGGYFMFANWTNLEKKVNMDSETDKYRDFRFTKWMTKNLGLQLIPVSAFYCDRDKHLGEDYVRVCFVKKDENLQKAKDILKKWSEEK